MSEVCDPAMPPRYGQSLLKLAALIVGYPLQVSDLLLMRRRSAYDGAGAVYFFGRKRQDPIPDRDILAFFRGA